MGTVGGAGESGFGRLNGIYGIREFAVPTHHAENAFLKLHKPYWYPYDEIQEKVVGSVVKAMAARGLGEKLAGAKDVVAGYAKLARSRF